MRPLVRGSLILCLALFFVAGCKKDSSPSQPQVAAPPTATPTVCTSVNSFGEIATTGTGNLGVSLTLSSPFTLYQSAAVTSFTVYTPDTASYRLGIYTDNTSTCSSCPATLIASSGAVTSTSAGVKVVPFPTTYLNPGTYWLALHYDPSSGSGSYRNNNTSGRLYVWDGDFVVNPTFKYTYTTFHLEISANYLYCP